MLVRSLHPEKESEVAQSCPTLCHPMDCSLPGSSVLGIFQATHSWSVLPFPSPGDLPDPGIEPGSPILQADALPSEPPGKPETPPHLLFSNLHLAKLTKDLSLQDAHTTRPSCSTASAHRPAVWAQLEHAPHTHTCVDGGLPTCVLAKTLFLLMYPHQVFPTEM